MMCMESQVCIIDSELTHSITIVCIIILIGFTTNIITSLCTYITYYSSIFADTALQKKNR